MEKEKEKAKKKAEKQAQLVRKPRLILVVARAKMMVLMHPMPFNVQSKLFYELVKASTVIKKIPCTRKPLHGKVV